MFRTATLVVVLSATAVHAQDNQPCAFPLASKKGVAIGIFNAIASGLQTTKKRRGYKIEIKDQGESWSIFQVLKSGDSVRNFTDKSGQKMESIRVIAGGGGLELTVNKCSAVVSDAHLSR